MTISSVPSRIPVREAYTLNKIAYTTLSKFRYFRTLLLFIYDCGSTMLPESSVDHLYVKTKIEQVIYQCGTIDPK